MSIQPNKSDSLEILEKELDNLPQRAQLHESRIIKDKINTKWCKGYLHFLDPPGPLTAVASYPGSGNTWLRYLIQQATGIATGSVYNAAHLKVRKFQKEILEPSTLTKCKQENFDSSDTLRVDWIPRNNKKLKIAGLEFVGVKTIER